MTAGLWILFAATWAAQAAGITLALTRRRPATGACQCLHPRRAHYWAGRTCCRKCPCPKYRAIDWDQEKRELIDG